MSYHKSGKKSYVVSYRVGKIKRFVVIGNFPNDSLQAMRQRAKEMLAGASPKPTTTLKFSEYAKIYVERRIMRMRSGSEELRRLDKRILPMFGNHKLDEITTGEVKLLHDRITKSGPIEANRVIQVLRRMLNRAKEWGYLPNSFTNPVDFIIEHPEQKRDRWVSREEMPRLLNAIKEVENVYVRGLFWLYLLTGARKQELMKLRYADIDFELSQARLRQTKNGKDYYLQLSRLALDIIKELPPASEFVFPGKYKTKPLVNIDKSWVSVKRSANLPDIRIHDLRRTLASWLANEGHSLHLIGAALNHSSFESTQIYARYHHASIKAALDSVAENYSALL